MKKIIVRAPALTQSGYGVQSRFALKALRRFPKSFDVYILPTVWGQTGWIWDDNDERRWIDEQILKQEQYRMQQGANAKFDFSLQVVIPNEFQPLAPINICYTAGIETTKISQPWFQGAAQFNKLIFTSNHAKYAFEHSKCQMPDHQGRQVEAILDVPMEVIPYSARKFEASPLESFELPCDFNFLVVAQWGPRKNLENTIKWFVETFQDRNIGLVLKLNTMANCLMDREHTTQRLKQLLLPFEGKRKCPIHLLHGDLTDEQMAGLYTHPKIRCLLSLSHGEGASLPIIEAVSQGLPVISPNWGGPVDYIHMPTKNKKGKVVNTCMVANVSYDIANVQPEAVFENMILADSQWCFPKEWHAKAQMKEMVSNYGPAKNRALKLQKYMLEKFDENVILQQFADAIFEDLPVIDIAEFLAKAETAETNPYLHEVVEYA